MSRDAFAGANDYRDTIERSVRYGNDTDTTACIAGGLAGTRFGIDGIPKEWLTGMRGRDIVAPLVDRLIATGGWRTSTDNPIRVDWVDLARVPLLARAPGHLGMTLLPGKQLEGMAGEHWRDLDLDAAELRDRHGIGALLLLIEDHELKACRVVDIGERLAESGIELVRYPIVYGGVPSDRDKFRTMLDSIFQRLDCGGSIAVASRGGLGRTGTVVACLLRDGGLTAEEAIALTRETRHHTVEWKQEPFVRDWDWPSPRPALAGND